MAKMNMHQRQRYDDDVQHLRRLVNRTPRWCPGGVDGHPVMIDDSGNVVLRFEGPWTPDLARLFTHLTYDVGIRLLVVLEATPGSSVQEPAVRFLEALNLHGTPTTHVLPHG